MAVADNAQAAPPTGPVPSEDVSKASPVPRGPEAKSPLTLAKTPHPSSAVPAPGSALGPPTSSVSTSASTKSGRVWTWVAAGGAVAALGGGALFGMQANSTSGQIASSSHSRADLDTLIANQSKQAGRAKLLLGVGAGLAVVAGTLWVLKF